MTSGGKRYPAKADLGAGRTRGRRRDLIARVSLMPMQAANATVPDRLIHNGVDETRRVLQVLAEAKEIRRRL
jgi:hypothetical protein